MEENQGKSATSMMKRPFVRSTSTRDTFAKYVHCETSSPREREKTDHKSYKSPIPRDNRVSDVRTLDETSVRRNVAPETRSEHHGGKRESHDAPRIQC